MISYLKIFPGTNFIMSKPESFAGIKPTTEKTEKRPPIISEC